MKRGVAWGRVGSQAGILGSKEDNVSQVNLIFSKSNSVSQSVKRSPIKLFWIAQKVFNDNESISRDIVQRMFSNPFLFDEFMHLVGAT